MELFPAMPLAEWRDTKETLHERIKTVERTLYPDVIERLATQ